MTAATRVRRPRPPIVAIVSYTLRSCLPARRWAAALIPAAAALLFGLISATLDEPAADAFAGVATSALFSLIMPVTCLVIGDAVLGAEVRSGSFTFTYLAPVPTWHIVLGRWLGGAIAAGGSLAVAFALAAVVAGTPESAGAAAISGVFGAGAYVAVFLAIGCITNRAAVWSLAFVFLVERLLGSALAGIAQLSPSWQAGAAFIGLTDGRADYIRKGIPQGGNALVRLTVIAVVAMALASARLRRLHLTGSND